MILSKRERNIAVTAAVAVVGLLLYWYVLTPLMAQRAALAEELVAVTAQSARDKSILQRVPEKKAEWKKMVDDGLSTDPVVVTTQALDAVRDAAQASGFNRQSIKSERVEQEKHFQRITFRTTGTGSMNAISRFLWRLQTAKPPLRLFEVQVTSRKEGTDDLLLQVGLSTLYVSPEAQNATRAPAPIAKD